jgi:hypothetical protein
VAAHAIAGLDEPTGLALKAAEFFVVDGAGRVTVVARPGVVNPEQAGNAR